MKKRLALILAMIMMALSLAACGASKDDSSDDDKRQESRDEKEATLVGEWETGIAFDDIFGDEFKESMGLEEMGDYFDFSELSDIVLVLEFEDDGTCTVAIDEESGELFVDEMIDMMLDGMLKMIEDMVAAEGMTMEDYYDAMGMTEEEFVETALEELDKESLLDSLEEATSETVYEEKDGKIYFGKEGEDEIDENEYWEYELDGDELEVTEVVTEDEDEAFLTEAMLPLTFERR